MAKTKLIHGEYKCKICTKVFSERAGLSHHIQLHTSDRPFACNKCTYTCKTKKYLHKHIARVHHKATGNECEICGKKFHFKCQLIKHTYVHTDAKPFKCEVCNKGFNSTYSLSSHRHLHTGEKPYKCRYCDYACRDNSTLRKHQERHTGVTRLYQCTVCDKSYKTKRVLKVHVAEVHMELDMKTKPCPECGKMFKTEKNLNNHVKQTHQRLFSCKCEICGIILSSKYNMTSHLTTHIDYRPFACGFEGCSKRYKDKQALKKHTIIHYPEKQFVCDVCHKKFTRLHRMQEHKRQHQVKKTKCVFCDYCGKSFYNKNYVRSHITRKHMFRQHYICDLCGLLTYNKPSIVMHLKYGHVSEMDRKCKICKKTYKKHLYLKAHYWNTHCIKYKLNRNKSRQKKSKQKKPETCNEVNENLMTHEVKVEPLSDAEDVLDSTEYSKGVLSEDVNRAMSGNRATAVTADTNFSDFFIEHIIMPSTSDSVTEQKERDVYVDVTSHKEAERVRSEMLKRWRKNGGVKPMKRVKRQFDGVIKKSELRKVKNEQIEITVFTGTESDAPNSEYKLNRNTVKECNLTRDSDISLHIQKNIMKNHSEEEHTNLISVKNDKDTTDGNNKNENRTSNEINEETSNLNNGKAVMSDIVNDGQELTFNIEKNNLKGIHFEKLKQSANNSEVALENNESIRGDNRGEENDKNEEVTSKENIGNVINDGTDSESVNKENGTQSAIQTNGSKKDRIGFENSLAEIVKLRKRKCVRNFKYISYRDSDNEDNDGSNINGNIDEPTRISSDSDVNLSKTTNTENNNLDSLEIVKNKRKSITTRCFKKTEDYTNSNYKHKEANDGMAAIENDDTLQNVENDDTLQNVENDDTLQNVENDDTLQNVENDDTLQNEQSNSRECDTNIDEHLEERDSAKPRTRRCVSNHKNRGDADLNSQDSDDDDDDDEDFVPDDGTDDRTNKLDKFKINTHQCYVCFKLYETKQKLLDHCKEHFEVCNMKMLKKCPLCDFVTNSDLVRHVRLMHDINLNYLYGTLKDRKNNNNKSRFYFNVQNDKINEVEVIPSIKNLNRQAFLKIDRERREKNDKEVKRTKLVKKDGEWIVEKELINTKKGNYVLPDKVEEEMRKRDKNGDVNNEKAPENEDYCTKIQRLSHIAKKNGQKMLFPCEKCEKICQTFSALKLHIRRHDPNAKPFKKKVWKHKLSEDELKKMQENKEKIKSANASNKNRYEKPKPIVHKHKCDPKLKDFYEKNIKGGDIEFWQFLKIFNKMNRENVNDFPDLENHTEFGNHFEDPNLIQTKESVSSKDSDTNPTKVSKSVIKPKIKKNRVNKVSNNETKFRRTILINKKEYLKRRQIKELLRKKNNEKAIM